ncbi:MAG: type II toxin-antitoxin system PemK/MazF family toxin [Candidatus Scalindua sp.]
MSYKKGDIVVVKFPFILKESAEIQKGRPAFVVFDDKVERRYKDVILAAITSQIPTKIMELEIILEPEKSNGLAKISLLRLDFIMTVPEELISRKIGVLPRNVEKDVEAKLKRSFGINTT